MSPSASVTDWLLQLQNGDRAGVAPLWERFFHRLAALARQRLGALPRAAADEEDVALSAFDSFCRRAEQGHFPQVQDRDDLWSVLVLIASRKACDLIQHERRDRRDHRRLEPTGAAAGPGEPAPLARLLSREPDPAFIAEMTDVCRHLLARLDDDEMRTIALLKLEGHTNEEIVARTGKAPATVGRRLALIRACWEGELPS